MHISFGLNASQKAVGSYRFSLYFSPDNIFIRSGECPQLVLYLSATLSNGPDKMESNNGIEHVGMQKGANFTIVFTILLIGLNSKS